MTATDILLKNAENGIIPVRLEEDAVRFRVGHLYADPMSAIRELYANELRACRLARDKYQAKPHIDITLNLEDRSIIIHGIDSLGITAEKFEKVLAVLGETDNTDATETGQFGWGVAAYSSCSDSIVYESYARETDERFSMLGINGEHFSKISQPFLNAYGTRVTIFVRETVHLDLAAVMNHICRYADIDTFLTVITDGNSTQQPPRNQINDPDIMNGLSSGTVIDVDCQDYRLVGVFTSQPANKQHTDVRLLTLPINATMNLPFDEWILLVKNERKYLPTADRERLTDGAIEKLYATIKTQLIKKLPEILDIASFADYQNRVCKYIYLRDPRYSSSEHLRLLEAFYKPSPETRAISGLLRLHVEMLGYRTYEQSRVNRIKIGDLITLSRELFIVSSLDRQLQDTLRSRYPTAAIFKFLPHRSRYHDSSFEDVTALKAQGIRTDARTEAEDIRRTLTVKRHPSPRSSEPVNEDTCRIIVHSTRTRDVNEHGCFYKRLADRTDNAYLRNVDDKTVFAPNLEQYLPILSQVWSDWSLSRLDRLPKQSHATKTTLARFLKQQEKRVLPTNKGALTFKALLNVSAPIMILVYADARINTNYSSTALFTALSPNDAFALALYLRANNKPYDIYEVPPEEEFKKATGKYELDYDYSSRNYDIERNEIVNIAFHVGLAVKNEELKALFLAAARDENTSPNTLRRLRDYALQYPRVSSR